MHIDNILNESIFDSNKEMKYSYRLVRENFFGGQAYGIEVERQDFLNNKLIYVERNEIRKQRLVGQVFCILEEQHHL